MKQSFTKKSEDAPYAKSRTLLISLFFCFVALVMIQDPQAPVELELDEAYIAKLPKLESKKAIDLSWTAVISNPSAYLGATVLLRGEVFARLDSETIEMIELETEEKLKVKLKQVKTEPAPLDTSSVIGRAVEIMGTIETLTDLTTTKLRPSDLWINAKHLKLLPLLGISDRTAHPQFSLNQF